MRLPEAMGSSGEMRSLQEMRSSKDICSLREMRSIHLEKFLS